MRVYVTRVCCSCPRIRSVRAICPRNGRAEVTAAPSDPASEVHPFDGGIAMFSRRAARA